MAKHLLLILEVYQDQPSQSIGTVRSVTAPVPISCMSVKGILISSVVTTAPSSSTAVRLSSNCSAMLKYRGSFVPAVSTEDAVKRSIWLDRDEFTGVGVMFWAIKVNFPC